MVIVLALSWLSLDPDGMGGDWEVVLAASDPVIAAAGDIACDPTSASFNGGNGTSGSCRQKATSELLVNTGLAAVLSLGDNQYYCGGYQAYLQAYDPSWGRVKSITRPVVGNHEYLTSGGTDCTTANTGAAGYFKYFGSAAGAPGQGYYSYDIGTWHLIALNSNCSDAGGCSSSSPQGKWLIADLAAHPAMCTLAYWHIPLFSSGGRAAPNMRSIWQILYNNDVDIVLSGHDHIYERFAPQTADGIPDTARGIREFIVGSGGSNHTSIAATLAANSEARNASTYGVLMLTLHPTSYDWKFLPEAGKTFTDSGTGKCHGTAPAVTPTSTGLALPANTPTAAAGTTFAFAPSDDAYIHKGQPNSNFGAAAALHADNSPVNHFLLKFNVSGLNGKAILRARLRLYAVDASPKGGNFYAVSNNTWHEATVTWSNAPASGTSLLASIGSVTKNRWYEVNVTSLITGDGTYSLRVSSASSDGVDYSSKEGANPPQLIVETQTAALPAPLILAPDTPATETPTAVETFAPTVTPMP